MAFHSYLKRLVEFLAAEALLVAEATTRASARLPLGEIVLIIVEMAVLLIIALLVVDLRLRQLLEQLGEGWELGLHLLLGVVVGVRWVPGCEAEQR